MSYTLDTIQQVTGALWISKQHPEARIDRLLLDSRLLPHAGGGLFFAIVGEHHNGHDFLEEAYRGGVRHFVVSTAPNPGKLPEADILQVKDTLLALQALAAWHRAHFHCTVVGITGSNGKTIVKEWLYQLLHSDFDIVQSPKSFNSQVGVPLSVWQMRERHQLGIFEAGISKVGEMEKLAAVIRPDVGIFTNLGPAHSEGFADDRLKTAEKMRLFASAKVLLYCADHPLIHEAAEKWRAEAQGRSLLSWSYGEQKADFQYVLDREATASVSVTAYRQNPTTGARLHLADFLLPFTDEASIENALHCYTFLHYMHLAPEIAAQRIGQLEPIAMRLELKAGIQHSTLINDAYSNDLASLRIALQFASQHSRRSPLVLVLSDILQSGLTAEALYREVAAILTAYEVTALIGIGTSIAAIRGFLPPELPCTIYPTTHDFIQHIPDHDWQDALILLKGARVFQFEHIARRLELKAHKTVLEVNLSALAHNLQVYNSLLEPDVRMMVMVKAAGYGAGPAELARMLEYHKVDYLGVAYIDEGVELRHAGVQLPILVLNPEASGYDVMYRHQLEPEVYNSAGLESLIHYAGYEKEIAIHIKLDTGMHRLGFQAADLPAVVGMLRQYPNLKVKSVFSHLASSDNPGHDQFTHQQAASFHQMAETLAAGLGYRPIRHIANTGGISRFPEYHFDMVRLGIGLYGVDSGALQSRLHTVNTLKATISQIKEVPAGDTVGYNRNGPVERPSRIATISIGYADGFLRLAGNGRYKVLVRGQKVPTIGNICMDMSMIDISTVPEAKEGDEVVIFGAELPVQELAACLQTIPYEVFTNIAERVKRVYWQD